MTQTLDKDFKVKNGLQVAGSGVFGGPVTAANPSNPNHLATKSYVDAISGGPSGGIFVGPEEPDFAIDGAQWFDSSIRRLKIFYGGEWFSLATSDDALVIIDHTHDPVTGLLKNSFIYGGQPEDSNMPVVDGGSSFTTYWTQIFDGGMVLELFDSGSPENNSLVFADGRFPETQTWNSLLDADGV